MNNRWLMPAKRKIIVSKQRNGPVGTVEVEWQDEFARFINKPGIRVPAYINENGD